jgi:hypothetical protein
MRKFLSFSVFSAVFALFGLTTDLAALDMFIEAKGAYFRPNSETFREIYWNRGIYGFEYTCQIKKSIYAWTSAGLYLSSGHSIGLHHSTTLFYIPVGFGLKFMYEVGWADLYLGAGALPTYVHFRSHSAHVIERSCKWGIGGIAKAGVIFNLPKSFFIDTYTDYSFVDVDFHNTDHHKIIRRHVDLSGWSVGLGVGYRFGAIVK